MYNIQDYSFLYNNAARPVICKCCYLLTCRKLLHDHIISL